MKRYWYNEYFVKKRYSKSPITKILDFLRTNNISPNITTSDLRLQFDPENKFNIWKGTYYKAIRAYKIEVREKVNKESLTHFPNGYGFGV